MTSGATTTFHSTITESTLNDDYYLFSSKSCPYAHRVEIVKNIKELDNIKIVWCDPVFKFTGWSLNYDYNSMNPSKMFNSEKLIELYKMAEPSYNGRGTLPLLYNLTTNTLVNNESSEIIKIFNSLSDNNNLYPENLKHQIDEFCTEFNQQICTNTYKAGHAKTMEEYTQLFNSVFEYLDKLNDMLTGDYIISDQLTLADVHAYSHLIRFDCVFYTLFSLNKKHLWEYSNICRYLKTLSSNPHFYLTVDLNEIKKGAYMSENNYVENMGCKKIPLGNGGCDNLFI